jgi:hypothetical protein
VSFSAFLKRRLSLGVLGLTICLGAMATVFGPFYVADMGPEYRQTTFEMDSSMEYAVAQKLAGTYLAPVLNTVSKIDQALKNDFMRVVYFGGSTIADYKISRWPSTIPLDFDRTVPDVNFKRPNKLVKSTAATRRERCEEDWRESRYNTGYWGVRYEDEPGRVISIGSWIDTGMITIRNNYPGRSDCNGK